MPDQATVGALHSAIASAANAGIADRDADAIVVGAGAAGGLASLLLAEAGLNVLTLDAGWRPPFLHAPYRSSVQALLPHLARPELMSALPPSIANFGRRAFRVTGLVRQPVQSKCFAWAMTPGSFVDDREFPYIVEPDSSFTWFRAHQLGGRMTIPGHGRQYHRLHASDFEGWPFGAEELAPWYAAVERRLGLSGRAEDDDLFGGPPAKETAPTPGEADTLARLAAHWPDTKAALGRAAPPLPSLELAAETGRLRCRRGAIVRRIDVDANGCVSGVTWYDRATRSERSAQAPIVFLCASALETARILLTSRTARAPEGLGAGSGALGKFIMDHLTLSCAGEGPALPGGRETPTPGRCVYLPKLAGIDGGRPFSVQIYRWSIPGGRSRFTGVTFSEMRPRADNRISLDSSRTDAFGNPVLRINCRYDEAELAAAAAQAEGLRALAKTFDVAISEIGASPAPPGMAMHEVGSARMGDAPDNSVLDPFNQCWDAKGLYVTDGAAFPTQGLAHPTLTIMALTARACAHAVRGGDAPKAVA